MCVIATFLRKKLTKCLPIFLKKVKLIYFKTVDLGVYDGKENLDLLEDVSKKTYNVTNTKLERKEILHKTELMI